MSWFPARNVSVLLVAAAMVTFAAATASARPTPATIHKPVVVAGGLAGPVNIHGNNTFATVATLHIPAGTWVILAKALVVNTTSSALTVRLTTCRLQAGSDVDRAQVDPVGNGDDSSEQVIELSLAHVFSVNGTARLDCAAENAATGDLKAKFIRMTAVEAGRFTTGIIGQRPTTTGAGKPKIVSEHLVGPVTVTNAAGTVTVGQVHVSSGPWFTTATAYVQSGASSNALATCELAAGGDFDQTKVPVDEANLVGDRLPFALTVVHNFGSPGNVDLNCSTDAGDVQIRYIVITAIHVGELTNENVGGGGTFTFGTGIPRIISAFDDGPITIHQGTPHELHAIPLGRGSWTIVAKMYAEETTNVARPTLTCQLAAGADTDEAGLIISPSGTVDNIQPLTLVLTHHFGPTGGDVRVLCGSDATAGHLEVDFLKVTSMRAGTLTTEPLS